MLAPIFFKLKFSMVTIYKLNSLLEHPHPNNIEEGYTRTGAMKDFPKIGEPFIVQRMGGFFVTSPVTEILESHLDMIIFKTENSVYRVDIE
jgi:hypothetical protein